MEQLDFHQKRKNLFDCLEQAEKQLESTSVLTQRSIITVEDIQPPPPKKPENRNKRSKLEVKGLSSRKESIFKRPELPIQRCVPSRHVPDFKVNPMFYNFFL